MTTENSARETYLNRVSVLYFLQTGVDFGYKELCRALSN